MNRQILLSALMMLMLISQVYALGVTPARTPLEYSPGEEIKVSFKVINSENENLNIMMIAQGDMNESVVFESNKFEMSASEEEREISVIFKMPDNLSPGRHDANIVLAHKYEASGNVNVGATLAVTKQISTFVPYPGKYLEGDLSVTGTEKQKKFVITLLQRGKDSIDGVSAVIKIFDSDGNEVKTLNTNEISLDVSGKGEISADWEVDAPQGKYVAKAALRYDGQEVLLLKEFEIGEFILDLQQIFVKDFKLGDVAKFNMVVKNKWNEQIDNAYSEMRVYDEAMAEIADIKSATYNIPAGMQTTMNSYWDTKGIKEGLYNANVILYYADKKTQQDLKLDVAMDKIDVIGLGYVISSQETSSGNKGIVTILVIVIAFLILVNFAWFFAFRKRKLKGNKK